MSFMNWIIEELEDIADFFYDAYQEVKDWWSPFDLLMYPLYGIYGRFHWLAEWFTDFRDWLEWANDWIDKILSWSNIRSMISSWLYGIESALDWFLSWTTWVGQYVNDWWSSILPYILTYIDNAVEGLGDIAATWENFWTITFPSWTSKIDDLRASWDNFWTTSFPNLVSFTWLDIWWQSRLLEIDALISSWFTSSTPFWEGWQEIRIEVTNFFADPLQWVYDKLDEFFERFW